MKLKMATPMAIAPISESTPRWPTMAISTMPTNGTVMFEIILGIASARIFRFMGQRSQFFDGLRSFQNKNWYFRALGNVPQIRVQYMLYSGDSVTFHNPGQRRLQTKAPAAEALCCQCSE